VDTGLLVQELAELLAPPAGFTLTTASPMPVFTTERALLEQVLRNLLENALKHHHQPEAARIHVAAHECGAKLEFTVTDNGPGINPAYHERIFQVFQTLQPRDEVEGSGMGLAIVKKIVEHQGGNVWVASTEGAGATFHFTWPKDAEGIAEQR
jgi:signal transduction histidine kinase